MAETEKEKKEREAKEANEREKTAIYIKQQQTVAEYGGFSNIPINHRDYWVLRNRLTRE